MQFSINNNNFEVRTLGELHGIFYERGFDFSGMSYSELINVLMSYYTGMDVALCKLMLSYFDIPTNNKTPFLSQIPA